MFSSAAIAGSSSSGSDTETEKQPCPARSMPSSASKLLPKKWQATISLPKTSFPPRAFLGERQKYLDNCSTGLYRWQRGQRNAERDGIFVLHDGPPFANGPLHIGHALNKILKDITCRFQLSLGKRVDFVPGWDCHGLPIEIKALEQHKVHDVTKYHASLSPLKIREVAGQLAIAAFEAQKKAFQQWGIMADWDNPWKTMDRDFEFRQLEVFSSMVKRGLISRKYKPVYWSPSSWTALAEAELEYRDDHESIAAYVKYPTLLDIRGKSTEVHALIWTTTPWTLAANQAIAVHSDLLYHIINTPKHGRLLIASTAAILKEQFLGESFEIVDSIKGEELVGQKYWDPVFTRSVTHRPILHADFVSATTGTGLVHLAPGHGMDDYELCQRHGIYAMAPVDADGCFCPSSTPDWQKALAGLSVLHEGNEKVLEILASNDALVKKDRYHHKYPYDWRTKQPVIIRATAQWFADVGQIRDAALKSLDNVTFVPKSGKERLASFVKNRAEWCISRQRHWGVPIPALYHMDTGEAFMTPESVDHIIGMLKNHGIGLWYIDNPANPRWIAPSLLAKYGPDRFRRGLDTMDVWFDSGTSWTTMMKEGDHQVCAPADVYLEGTDQHRGWFQSSLLTYITRQTGCEASDGVAQAPFKTLITHGFVLDGKGRKMSKSIGNVTSPDEIMQGTLLARNKKKQFEALGPDALRLWVASSDYTSDVRVNTDFLQTIHTNLIKYRNTFRYILGVLEDFKGPLDLLPTDLSTPHRIALLQLRDAFDSVHGHYSRQDYGRAIADINRYIAQDLSASYMGMVKDVLYTDRGTARWQAQLTLLIIHQCLQTMLAPVIPLLVEETWHYTPNYIKNVFVHPMTTLWADQKVDLDRFDEPQLAEDMPILDDARKAVNTAQEKARSAKCMGSSLDCYAMLQIEKLGEGVQIATECFQRYLSDFATLFVVSRVDVCEGFPPLHVWSPEWIFSEEFEVNGTKVIAHVFKPSEAKCIRCWRYLAPVEAKPEEALCDRCEAVVDELRQSQPHLFEKTPEEEEAVSAIA